MTKVAKVSKRIIVNLKDLKPHPKNAKVHPKWQVEKLGQYIEEDGYDQEIVIDEKNTILKGKGRWMALLDRKFVQAEVVLKEGLTEEQKLTMIVRDNKIFSLEYDKEILSKVVPLLDKQGIDTGYSEKEIKLLLADPNLEIEGEKTYDLSPRLYEHYDYIVLFFKTDLDFKFAKQVFNLKIVRDRMKHQKVGVLRAIDGITGIEQVKKHFKKAKLI